MNRGLVLLTAGWFLVFFQTTMLPRFLPGHLKPDLVLLLVLWIGLREPPLRGGLVAFGLGCLTDAFAGTTLGLYGLTLLIVALVVKGAADRLNTESGLLLLGMVAVGTLLAAGILGLLLGMLAGLPAIWPLLFRDLPIQLLLNLVAGGPLLLLAEVFYRRRRIIAGGPP